MDSYGEVLRKRREERSLDIATVVRETAITREYIEALETENSDAFPGEAYLVGFLRNYANYLDISPSVVINLYHNKTLQESPAPRALLAKRRAPFVIPLAVAGGVIAVLLLGVAVWMLYFRASYRDGRNVVLSAPESFRTYTLSDTTFRGRLYRGDQVVVPSSNGDIVLTVRDTLFSLGLETPVGALYIDLAEEMELDVDGDTVPDVIVYVSDISSNDESRGAEVRMLMRRSGVGQATVDLASTETLSEADIKNHVPFVILEDNRAYPFTLNAVFRGSCEFRYRIDNGRSEEFYLSSGQAVTISANNGIRVWMSSSTATILSVLANGRTYTLDAGRARHVLVEDVRWIRTTDGRYQLVVVELD
ncbi:MAG: helix-turn-helix domain-containing protein [Treponema sp.]|nr:helix-turn-helix domain-containing protein [Treponema sp.]